MMTKFTFRKRMLALAHRHVTNINRFELGCTGAVVFVLVAVEVLDTRFSQLSM
jgi:hypothetical protein